MSNQKGLSNLIRPHSLAVFLYKVCNEVRRKKNTEVKRVSSTEETKVSITETNTLVRRVSTEEMKVAKMNAEVR